MREYINNIDCTGTSVTLALAGDDVFFEIGIIEDGVPLITREAPAFGDNLGGAIEVVVPSNSMKLESFNLVTFDK